MEGPDGYATARQTTRPAADTAGRDETETETVERAMLQLARLRAAIPPRLGAFARAGLVARVERALRGA